LFWNEQIHNTVRTGMTSEV